MAVRSHSKICSHFFGNPVKFKLLKAGNGDVFFLNNGGWDLQSRQSCSSTVPLPLEHIHQRMWRLYPHSRIVGGWTQATQPGKNALLEYVLTLRTELQTYAEPMLLWFAGCKNSTTFKLSPPGMRGALGLEWVDSLLYEIPDNVSRQTLLEPLTVTGASSVSVNNIGTYYTWTTI